MHPLCPNTTTEHLLFSEITDGRWNELVNQSHVAPQQKQCSRVYQDKYVLIPWFIAHSEITLPVTLCSL